MPRLFYSLWASSFQALGKAAMGASQLGPETTPNAQGGHLMCPPHTYHLSIPPGPWVLAPGTISGLQGWAPAFTQPSPISASLHKPQTHSTSRLLAPAGASRNFLLFNARQATCCFRCQARHNERTLPSQKNAGNQEQVGQWGNEAERG